MNTEFFKPAQLKQNVRRHGGKAIHGLSAGAIAFLYFTFAQRSDVERLEKFCERLEEKRAVQWQKIMDHEVTLARMGRTSLDNTNAATWVHVVPYTLLPYTENQQLNQP